MYRQKLETLIKILIYTAFFVPLIVIPSSFIFPFIVPKIVILRTLIQIMLGAYVLLLIINWKEYKPTYSPLTIAVFCFYILSFGLSTFFGVDAYHSFWDNHERMLGFFTIAHYFIFYLMCSKFIKNWTSWKWAMRIFLFAGLAVMFVGLLQVGNPQLLLNQGSERVASTLGNPIYVGGYALFLAFMAVLLILKDKNRIWKYVYGIMMIFILLGLFFSGTRGAMLGLVAGVGTVLLIYAIALRGYKKTRIAIGGAIALMIVIVGMLYVNRQTDFVKDIPAVGRAVNTSLSDVKASPRWIAWEIAWDSFVERPAFGWGPNNYFYAFNQHYNPRSLDYGYGETWFDNAHNIVMNTLSVQGALGILSYLALFLVAFFVLVRAYRHKDIDIHLLAIGTGFLVAHFIGNITVFENITSYLYFMFWLAMINRLTLNKQTDLETVRKEEEKLRKEDKMLGSPALIITGLIVLLSVNVFNIRPASANMKTLDAIKGLSTNPVLGLEKMRIALETTSPHIDDIRSDISRTATQLVSNYGDQIDQNLAKNIISLAYSELEKNIILHPRDVRNYISLAQLAQMKAYLENNTMYFQEAFNHLETALKYSPNRQQIMYSLSSMHMQVGQTDKAIELLEQAIKDNKKIGESYWRLAYTYLSMNEIEKAFAIMDLAQTNEAVFTPNDQLAIDQIFAPYATSTTGTVKTK
jgi:O-antigen ligase